MLKLIQKIQFKRRIIRDLEQGAWQDEISAGYSGSIIPDLEAMIANEQKRIEENNRRIGEISPNNKQGYDERKKLGKDSDEAVKEIAKYQVNIQMIKDEVIKKHAAAAEKRTRIAFIKKNFKPWK